MPELTQNEIAAFSDFLKKIIPNFELALAERVSNQVQLEMAGLQSVPVQTLLTNTDNVLNTVYSLSQPVSVESMYFILEESAHQLAHLLDGTEMPDSPLVLTDSHLEQLSTVMAGLASGFCVAINNLGGETSEVETCTTHFGPMTLPPVFAMEGLALQAQLTMTVGDELQFELILLFTPDYARTLAPESEEPAASEADDFSGILNEDELAAMLGEIGGSPNAGIDPEPASSSSPPMMAGASFANLPTSGGQESFLPRGMELILDIPLDVTVELGRVRMLIKDVLELSSGSIIELDRVAGEPVDLLVNGRLIAKGEVVVIEDNFGIRITEIMSPSDRVLGLGKGR